MPAPHGDPGHLRAVFPWTLSMLASWKVLLLPQPSQSLSPLANGRYVFRCPGICLLGFPLLASTVCSVGCFGAVFTCLHISADEVFLGGAGCTGSR